jgi:flagellar basal-body rod protein FlgG
MRALSIAATGMAAQQLNVEVIANNIANSNTTAFKRNKAEFADLLYQTERQAGVPNRTGGEPIPEGMQVGLGVQPVAVRSLNLQGPITSTGNQLDLALNGRGWFQVSGPNNQTLYTRAGSFGRNAQGQLVTQDGYQVVPNITLPQNTTNITIISDGTVYVDTGTGTLQQAGNCKFPERSRVTGTGQ